MLRSITRNDRAGWMAHEKAERLKELSLSYDSEYKGRYNLGWTSASSNGFHFEDAADHALKAGRRIRAKHMFLKADKAYEIGAVARGNDLKMYPDHPIVLQDIHDALLGAARSAEKAGFGRKRRAAKMYGAAAKYHILATNAWNAENIVRT
jgi:hypothetical protein